jgi:DNA-binding XRE family transcriptional regulator
VQSAEDIELGRYVVREGLLQQLRAQLGLTRNAMAELLHTSYPTYTSWENRKEINLWPSTAQRLGRFYRIAQHEIELLDEVGIKVYDLVPFHMVATHLGIPQELLFRLYREDKVEAYDTGIMGLWVEKRELRRLRDTRCQ